MGVSGLIAGMSLADAVWGQLSDAVAFICLLMFLKLHQTPSI